MKKLFILLTTIIPYIIYSQNNYEYRSINDSLNVSIKKNNYASVINFGEQLLNKFKNELADSSLVRIKLNTGYAHKHSGNLQKAKQYANDCIIKLEKQNSKNIQLAKAYELLALSYNHSSGNIGVEPGIDAANKALAIRKKIFGNDHHELYRPYFIKGELYIILRDKDASLENNYKGLNVLQKKFGENHIGITRGYKNIGLVYANENEYDKALKHLLKAQKIREKLFPHVSLLGHSNLCTNLATLYYRLGEHNKGLLYQEKALELKQKILGKDSPTLINSYARVAAFATLTRNYEKAKNYFSKAIDFTLSQENIKYGELAQYYNAIAKMYSSLKQYHKAITYFHKAMITKKK
ncbi:tetratricopeptide repeat protein [Pseudofulvibacter geojedonensis]|uniref:Tetratricopeptide repeat protein n=1 Tax=Pseudofulvibacter geojedonensis TaxID=1123758 RepID=A0ABW3I4W3_9FLAO